MKRNKASFNVAAIVYSGVEFSTRVLTGLIRYVDENPAINLFEFPHREGMPVGFSDADDFDGAVIWADRSCSWVSNLVARGVKVVNCCQDWEGEPGIVSLGLDTDLRCQTIVDHYASRNIRQFAAITAEIALRPTIASVCSTLQTLAAERGWASQHFEISGRHPDYDRSRISHVAEEKELLSFLQQLAKPAAVWCENDYVARMVCNAATHLDMVIPDQLAVLGNGDYQIGRGASPTISTIPTPGSEVGTLAAQLLHQWMQTGLQPHDQFVPTPPIVQRDTTAKTDSVSLAIVHAREIIETEACTDLTVADICTRVNVSKMTLTKGFADAFGVTPGVYIRQRKAEVAKQLLRDSQQSIGEIGAAIGYSEQSKFSKFFKREAGVTPREFRHGSGTSVACIDA